MVGGKIYPTAARRQPATLSLSRSPTRRFRYDEVRRTPKSGERLWSRPASFAGLKSDGERPLISVSDKSAACALAQLCLIPGRVQVRMRA